MTLMMVQTSWHDTRTTELHTRTLSPILILPPQTASSNASYIEAADVLPCSANLASSINNAWSMGLCKRKPMMTMLQGGWHVTVSCEIV